MSGALQIQNPRSGKTPGSALTLAANAPIPLIADEHRPNFAVTLPDCGRGHQCYGALDRKDRDLGLMAIAVEPNTQARTVIITSLIAVPIEGVLNPVAHGGYSGPGHAPANYVICARPPGPSLATQSGRTSGGGRLALMSDLELIECVLRPAARTLDALAQRRLTHRAIRPDNLFSAARGQPAVLGAAWAGPPAALQPAIYEPPYSAQCHRYGRGGGTIADDIYALGVSLLSLALGEERLTRTGEEQMLRRKLHSGSFAALVEDARLSSALSDLLRGMLAEDPDHRPPPVLLTDPGAARARRVAARPPRRAQRPLMIGGLEAWNARSVAHALAVSPDEGALAIAGGAIDRWLRRMLGDVTLAHRFDAAMTSRDYEGADGHHAEQLRLARAAAALDPLAPFPWRGVTFWPEALGPMLAAGAPDIRTRIEEVIATDAVTAWATVRPERCDLNVLLPEMRQIRAWFITRGMAGAMPRVLYGLNHGLPCQSALTGGLLVNRLAEALLALEQTANTPDQRKGLPADPHLISFIAVHSEHRHQQELLGFIKCRPEALPIMLLRLFASIQTATAAPPLPHLSAWLAALCVDRIEQWQGKENRGRLAASIKAAAEAGSLRKMLELIEDHEGRAGDRANAEKAAAQVTRIDRELAKISVDGATRKTRATALAHDAAGALALSALSAALLKLVFGW